MSRPARIFMEDAIPVFSKCHPYHINLHMDSANHSAPPPPCNAQFTELAQCLNNKRVASKTECASEFIELLKCVSKMV